MRDIDEVEDLMGLAERLRSAKKKNGLRSAKKKTGSADEADKERGGDKLCRPPPGKDIEASTGNSDEDMCRYSWEAIQQLKI